MRHLVGHLDTDFAQRVELTYHMEIIIVLINHLQKGYRIATKGIIRQEEIHFSFRARFTRNPI